MTSPPFPPVYRFVTGSDRIPVEGLSQIRLIVTSTGEDINRVMQVCPLITRGNCLITRGVYPGIMYLSPRNVFFPVYRTCPLGTRGPYPL